MAKIGMVDCIEESLVDLACQEHFDRKIRREEKIKKKLTTKDFKKAKRSLNRHLVKRYYRGHCGR